MSITMELLRPPDIFTPKFHVIFHALSQTGTLGNPGYYACWLDESLNKALKACCRHASQATFEEVVLHKTKETLKQLGDVSPGLVCLFLGHLGLPSSSSLGSLAVRQTTLTTALLGSLGLSGHGGGSI